MISEREELMLVIAAITAPQAQPVLDIDDDGAIVVDAKKLADAIIAAGYSKASPPRAHRQKGIKVEGGLVTVTITGDTPLKPDLTIGERITNLEHGLREPEWGVSWGDEIRPVPDKARAKYIARVMGADLYGRYPLGKWMKVVS